MSRSRDADGFEVEAPVFTKKVRFSDINSDTATDVVNTNDDSNFRGEDAGKGGLCGNCKPDARRKPGVRPSPEPPAGKL